jgi:hypothetical protein
MRRSAIWPKKLNRASLVGSHKDAAAPSGDGTVVFVQPSIRVTAGLILIGGGEARLDVFLRRLPSRQFGRGLNDLNVGALTIQSISINRLDADVGANSSDLAHEVEPLPALTAERRISIQFRLAAITHGVENAILGRGSTPPEPAESVEVAIINKGELATSQRNLFHRGKDTLYK